MFIWIMKVESCSFMNNIQEVDGDMIFFIQSQLYILYVSININMTVILLIWQNIDIIDSTFQNNQLIAESSFIVVSNSTLLLQNVEISNNPSRAVYILSFLCYYESFLAISNSFTAYTNTIRIFSSDWFMCFLRMYISPLYFGVTGINY